ncbi:MAG: hypothetical protein MR436_13020, partial [Eubacterium sp.]|nr:hypothetical protein [Eubacterium sp.]
EGLISMPFSYEAPVVVITISKHVRTNHPDSSTYSELYQLSTEFPRPLYFKHDMYSRGFV